MAKYRKSRKHRPASRRRRRVGAMALSPSSTLVKFAPIVLGYFFGDKINAPIETAVAGKVDGKVIAGGELALGYLIAFKGKKSLVKAVAGGLLLGAGAKKAMTEFGIGNVLGGYHAVPVIGGYENVPVIGRGNRLNGYTVPAVPQGLGAVGGYDVPAPMSDYANSIGIPDYQKVMGCVDDCGTGINNDDR